MRIKELVQRRVSAGASSESLRALSPKEVQQIAGGLYFGLFDGPLPQPIGPMPGGDPTGHTPFPGSYVP
jgi:hypothetical protein